MVYLVISILNYSKELLTLNILYTLYLYILIPKIV